MTLSDLALSAGAAAASEHRSERKARGVGVALGKCLRQAQESGRLKCGITASASLLQRCPERVLLCLLPVPQNSVCDHALHIHHTLISAFCAEHAIRCLRVHEEDLNRAVFNYFTVDEFQADGKSHSNGLDNDVSSVWHHHHHQHNHNHHHQQQQHQQQVTSAATNHSVCSKPDASCVLVKSPKDGGLSFEDEVVLDYHDDVMSNDVYPKPVLSIPG